jgi:hypothetical protein
MLRNARRIDVIESWRRAREAYASVLSERDALRQELAETKQALRELQAAVLERQRAEYVLVTLQREREIARARAAERDPNTMLN